MTTQQELMAKLVDAGDRFRLYNHEMTASWVGTDPASPATRQEMLDGHAALGEVMGTITEALVYILVALGGTPQVDGE